MGLDDMKWIILLEDFTDLNYRHKIYTDNLEEWVISRDYEERRKERPELVIRWIKKIEENRPV